MKEYQERGQAWIDEKRRNRMSQIDALPDDIRALVHEYGFNVVNAFRENGVSSARRIRHLVETVLNEFSPTRGAFSAQGPRARYDAQPQTETPQ